MEREEENPTSLTTPLNEHDIHDDDDDNDDDEDGGCRAVERERNRKEEIAKEVKKQLWLAGPLVCTSVLQFSLQLISLMYVGHLGELPLSGASMATSFATVTGFSLLLGMASALDTLCGQSYGAEQYHMLGIHMQRAMLILSLVSIPLAIIWANTHAILVAFGQDHDISEEAQIYARFMIPSIFAYALLQCLVKFLQTQNIVFPMMISSGITTLIHLLVCWALVFKTDLGLRGAALANSISYWTNVVLLALYVKFSSSCAKTWTGLSKEALHDILNFLGLAIPSAVMVCLEMWSFEMIVLASGLLPDPELQTSVLSICLNTTTTVWMITYGLGNAVSTRVSNELGAGRPYAARLAVCVVLVMAVTEAVIVGAVMISIRNIWGYAYSDVVEVVRYVAAMMPILAASNFLDALQGVLSGTVRGCGRQKAGAFVNLGSYYIVGIPSAIVFAFVLRIGGKGLWFGIICGLIVQVLSLSTITLRTNWEQQAKKATERVYDSTIPVDTVS
ncbi:protein DETOXIFICATION 16-like isoform X1 [Camellia sinensis]|uniref:protein DETOXIFICATION 16-like isoform X1 n=2 Tax=Camellia sinensis TaxID=4442 RepID=UPI001035E6E2|nr:protein DETOXIFICATION 16-like isoform X1 [Camellia sinensis]